MVREHRVLTRAGGHGRPGAARAAPRRRRRRARRAVLRHGARRRPRLPQRAARRVRRRARRARGDRRGARRRARRAAHRRPGRRGPRATSAGRRASWSASCGAGRKQWEASKAHELPALDALRDGLVRTLPPQRAEAIVHGDYRLDNTVLHPTAPGRIVAVLDWEMSTLGDPFTDLGALLAFWSEEADDAVLRRGAHRRARHRGRGLPHARAGHRALRRADGLRRHRRRLVPGVRLLQARGRLPGDRRARRRRRHARLGLRRRAAPRRPAGRCGPPPARLSARQRVRRQMDSGRLRSVGRCGVGGGGGGGVIGPTSRRRR